MTRQQVIDEIKQIVNDLNINQLEELYKEHECLEDYLDIKYKYFRDGLNHINIFDTPMLLCELQYEWLNRCNFDLWCDSELEDILNEYRKLKVKENK
jgi:hypothetical protein